MEIESGATRTSVRILVEGSARDVDDHSSTEGGPLAAISRKFSRRHHRQRDTTTSTLPIQKVGTGSSATGGEVTSMNEDAATNGESRAFTCRDVTGNCRSEKKTSDRDDVTVSTLPSHADACTSAGGATGSRTIDNSGDVPLTTPTSGHEDGGGVRVRFRFDSVSCKGAVQKDVSSTLPKEPHPVRDQTVHRRTSPRDEAARGDAVRSECVNDISLSPPELQRTLSNSTDEDANDVATPRTRSTFTEEVSE